MATAPIVSKVNTMSILLAVTFSLAFGADQHGNSPIVGEIVSGLHSSNTLAKFNAALTVSQRADLRSDPRVQQAVLSEMVASTELLKRRRVDNTFKIPVADGQEYANVHISLLDAAAQFDGPEVFNALLPEVGIGAPTQKRLAQFGAGAIDALVALYESPNGSTDPEAMRMGIQKVLATIALQNQLSVAQQTELRGISARGLQSTAAQEVAGAIYLGAALRDPDLIRKIRALEAASFKNVTASAPDLSWLRTVVPKAFAQAGIR